jgi:hypothetical protein
MCATCYTTSKHEHSGEDLMRIPSGDLERSSME